MAYAQPSFTGLWAPAEPSVPATDAGAVRMECEQCGSHVVVEFTSRLGGQCLNCSSYQLRPVRYELRLTDPPVRPEERADEPAPW